MNRSITVIVPPATGLAISLTIQHLDRPWAWPALAVLLVLALTLAVRTIVPHHGRHEFLHVLHERHLLPERNLDWRCDRYDRAR